MAIRFMELCTINKNRYRQMVNWNDPNSCYQMWFVFSWCVRLSRQCLITTCTSAKLKSVADNCYSIVAGVFWSTLVSTCIHTHKWPLQTRKISPLNARQYNVFTNTKTNEYSRFRFFTKIHRFFQLLLLLCDISFRLCFRFVFSFVHTISSLLPFSAIHLQHLSAVCAPVARARPLFCVSVCLYVCVCVW